MPENLGRLPAIAVRMTIIARDAGLEKLHSELLLLSTDLHRRIYLKDKITRIKIGVNDSNTTPAPDALKLIEPSESNQPQITLVEKIGLMEHLPALKTEPPPENRTLESSTEAIPLAAHQKSNNPEFKKRMRNASRFLDIN